VTVPFLDLRAMNAELSAELDAVWHDVNQSGAFIGGKLVDTFEREWADYCATRYCVGVASGTAALELSLKALGIGAGDEVIVPANTFIATAAAVASVGACPVFVDVDPSTLLLTAENVRAALTSQTAAVVVVHLYGQAADMDAINDVASRAGICVIEDAAQAHGATWRGRRVGGLADMGCFSFYPGKNLGAFGDAGAVVTGDLPLAQRIRSLSNHGRCHDDPYRHDLVGANQRLDALQAGVLSVKLRRLDDWNLGRQRAAARYATALDGLPVRAVATAPEASSSYHLFVVETADRDRLRRVLETERIGTGVHYPIPCHRQRPFERDGAPTLPIAERAAKRVLSLPMFPHLSDGQIALVADALRMALTREAADHARVA
jgi:dTDP-4-amino-4,6-dideoxygalactose transaminase